MHSIRLEAAAKSARLNAELEFLEQVLKEASIADAEERVFKRLLHEEQSGHQMTEFSDEMHVKVDPSFLTDLRLHEIPNIKVGDFSIHREHADAPSHKQQLAKPEYQND